VVRCSFVLAVPQAGRAAAWWVEVMGFTKLLEIKGWVFVRRGACTIRLGSCPDALPPRNLGDHAYFGYIEIDSIDAYHAAISASGAHVGHPPADRPWGMREMAVETPDGHPVMFAERLDG
jgi:catechol 2,3-dioxygenase-like lactoylglutathione lyase family enzyme